MRNENISACTACPLYTNQRPLLDHIRKADVMWVGVSAKRVADPEHAIPLDVDTNSGQLIADIEARCSHIIFYKTNLVKCLPLDAQQKLRYPTAIECGSCAPNLDLELELTDPEIVFLLGAKVANFVLGRLGYKRAEDIENYTTIKHQGRCFIPIPHPSFIMVYKRKAKYEYIARIQDLIEQHATKLTGATDT